MERGLLDTSILIAAESGRRINRDSLPDEGALSPATLAELEFGVLSAKSIVARSVRMRTLEAANEFELCPIDDRVARAWALLRAHLRGSRRQAGVNDLWIAATALANRIPVYTQDDDFDDLEGVGGLTVIKV